MPGSGGFNANYGAVSGGIDQTAKLIVAANRRRALIVQNVHATQILYVGDDDQVTTGNGLKIAAGASLTLEGFTGALYGDSDGDDTDVRYFEVT